MSKLMYSLSLIIWIGWLVYAIVGKSEYRLRIGLVFACIVCISSFIEKLQFK